MILKLESTKRRLSESASREDLVKAIEIIDREYLEFVVDPLNEDVPFAWDSMMSIEGSNVIIRGELLPGGPGYGKVTIEVPVDKFKDLYELRLMDYEVIDEIDSLTEEEKDLLKRVCTPV